MITVKEIAKMCDVSPSTVSNILNGKPNVSEKTRQKVWQAVKETGYQPNYYAANMRKQSTRTISIIAEDLGQFSTTPILEAAMACCEEHEYRTVIMNLRLYDKWRDTWYNDEIKLQSMLSQRSVTAPRLCRYYETLRTELLAVEQRLLADYREGSEVTLTDDHAIKAAYDEVTALLQRHGIVLGEGKVKREK